MILLQLCRVNKRLSQYKLAALVGCNQSAIHLMEQRGLQPTADQRKLLAAVLDCDPDALTDEVDVTQIANQRSAKAAAEFRSTR